MPRTILLPIALAALGLVFIGCLDDVECDPDMPAAVCGNDPASTVDGGAAGGGRDGGQPPLEEPPPQLSPEISRWSEGDDPADLFEPPAANCQADDLPLSGLCMRRLSFGFWTAVVTALGGLLAYFERADDDSFTVIARATPTPDEEVRGAFRLMNGAWDSPEGAPIPYYVGGQPFIDLGSGSAHWRRDNALDDTLPEWYQVSMELLTFFDSRSQRRPTRLFWAENANVEPSAIVFELSLQAGSEDLWFAFLDTEGNVHRLSVPYVWVGIRLWFEPINPLEPNRLRVILQNFDDVTGDVHYQASIALPPGVGPATSYTDIRICEPDRPCPDGTTANRFFLDAIGLPPAAAAAAE